MTQDEHDHPHLMIEGDASNQNIFLSIIQGITHLHGV